MEYSNYEIVVAAPDEYTEVGELMAKVYAALKGFPSRAEQPNYYALFDDLGALVDNDSSDLLIARSLDGELLGSVIYFGDMKHYGSGGIATSIKRASGLRLLAVLSTVRGYGIGRALTNRCIESARRKQHEQVVLHTTQNMEAAWQMYERMGFKRYEEIDFLQGELPVFGFSLAL